MTHAEYMTQGQRLAERHKELQHSESNNRFYRMYLSFNPEQLLLDMTDFFSALRNKIKDEVPFMVLQNYMSKYADNRGDNKEKHLDCAFMVLQKLDKSENKDAVYDHTEQIGAELLAAWRYQLLQTYKHQLPVHGITSEPIGPIGTYFYGTRYNFTIVAPANAELHYNPSKFLE
ncbi:hypothetical protein [Pontibacter sp. SGAir0037]|uniref:hypothetical protein n=1 Tax=Pontibacter sp. SGAir0037 TaxID=2571030 RepID=UPI0010CD5D8F|nr:hypothetical protein [Pontibacter sp. SGAir0037]QCR23070.1 hypothetical protein C1N53_12430 [Pontibacter sp. SGAir0037]